MLTKRVVKDFLGSLEKANAVISAGIAISVLLFVGGFIGYEVYKGIFNFSVGLGIAGAVASGLLILDYYEYKLKNLRNIVDKTLNIWKGIVNNFIVNLSLFFMGWYIVAVVNLFKHEVMDYENLMAITFVAVSYCVAMITLIATRINFFKSKEWKP